MRATQRAGPAGCRFLELANVPGLRKSVCGQVRPRTPRPDHEVAAVTTRNVAAIAATGN